MIAGEYAVLCGAPALVVASAQRAICEFSPRPSWEFDLRGLAHADDSLVKAVFSVCEHAALVPHRGHYVVDTRAFFSERGVKYGLGSSAAACVALCKMIMLQHSVDDSAVLLDISQKSHHEFSCGLGSGADIAASCYGIPILFERHADTVHVSAVKNHPFLDEILVIATKRAQNTREFVKKFVAAQQSHARIVDDFCSTSRRYCVAMMTATTAHAFIHAMDALYQALFRFGRDVDLAIVTEEHRALHDLATRHAGSAKPSGAGGGDIAIVYVPPNNRASFLAALALMPQFCLLSP